MRGEFEAKLQAEDTEISGIKKKRKNENYNFKEKEERPDDVDAATSS